MPKTGKGSEFVIFMFSISPRFLAAWHLKTAFSDAVFQHRFLLQKQQPTDRVDESDNKNRQREIETDIFVCKKRTAKRKVQE